MTRRSIHASRLSSLLVALVGILLLISCGTPAPPPVSDPVPAEESLDALAPTTSAADAETLQLHAATFGTNDIDEIRRFFVDGMGLRIQGPFPLDSTEKAARAALWGVPADREWELYYLDRPAVEEAFRVRVLHYLEPAKGIHKSWDCRERGPFSFGFPTDDAESWDKALREMGYGSMSPLEKYPVPRTDGTLYGIHETIFQAPEFLHAVVISRRDGMRQLGPTDPATGRGGPAYSAVVVDNSDEVLAFYVDLLGLELRSDRRFESSGKDGAMGLPEPAAFRFSIVYAKGARTGHLLIVDFEDDFSIEGSGEPWTPPAKGLTGWTFPVRDLGATRSRLVAAGTPVVHEPTEVVDPLLGKHQAMTVRDPNGYLVELIEFDAAPGS